MSNDAAPEGMLECTCGAQGETPHRGWCELHLNDESIPHKIDEARVGRRGKGRQAMTDARTCPRCGVEFIGWSGTRRFERCDTQANQPMHTDARCADHLAARLRETLKLIKHQDALLVAYRTDSRPSEATLNGIREARAALAAATKDGVQR